ncbi:MAG TPA: undecaprenyl-diphosphate phosphatase [Clostridiales bacterium]|jgi:undecaprenyl-diphosphatase|nr:undecaprenyl-diphosphate phosphatase [Clostridiales bacterium]
MTIWEAVILGLIQGITEFLPISSSGHLVFLQNVWGIESGLSFNIIVHLATLIAVIAAMFDQIKKIFSKPFFKPVILIVISTLPAVLIALLFEGFLKSSFDGRYLGWGFLISAIFLVIGDFICEKQKPFPLADIDIEKSIDTQKALLMGVFQGIAVFPGISRSGTTISSGLVLGLDRETAARFSFLMSIPIILGAVVFDIIDIGVVSSNIGAGALIAGFVSALISGYFAAKIMLKILSKRNFWGFSIYLILMSLLSFIFI